MTGLEPADRRNVYPWALIGLFVAVSAWGNWLHSAGAEGAYRVLPALVPVSAAFAWHLLVLRHFDGTDRADRFRRLAARCGAAVVFGWTMVGSYDALVQVGERGHMPHPTALPVAVDGLVFVAALAVWTARHRVSPPAVVAELAALRLELERVRASIPTPVSVEEVRSGVARDVLAEVDERLAAAVSTGLSTPPPAGLDGGLDSSVDSGLARRTSGRVSTLRAVPSPVQSTARVDTGQVDSGLDGSKSARARLIQDAFGLGRTRAFSLADDPAKVAEARTVLADRTVDGGG